MTSYNIYPPVPSALEDPQIDYHLGVIQSKRQGLLKLEERCKKKYNKVHQNVKLTGSIKHLFQWIKHSHWNI